MGFSKDAANNTRVPFYYYQGASIDQTKRNRKRDPVVWCRASDRGGHGRGALLLCAAGHSADLRRVSLDLGASASFKHRGTVPSQP
jgi:hypothetical protein